MVTLTNYFIPPLRVRGARGVRCIFKYTFVYVLKVKQTSYNIKFLSFTDCDGFVDFSSIDICELPKIMFVYLRGTKNNFEELFDCYEKLSNDMYDLEKPDPPYFKDDRLSDVPEPRFSMNESDLKRLVKKIIK
jgi:hypothetical protein